MLMDEVSVELQQEIAIDVFEVVDEQEYSLLQSKARLVALYYCDCAQLATASGRRQEVKDK